jgi:hypothetical protein
VKGINGIQFGDFCESYYSAKWVLAAFLAAFLVSEVKFVKNNLFMRHLKAKRSA